jgi:hypothetical protein
MGLTVSIKFASSTALIFALLTSAAWADEMAEVATASVHAGLVSETTSVHIAQMHMQHILNCLTGPDNPGYDKTIPNPCKGQGAGAIPDSTDLKERKVLEDCAAKATAALKKDNLEDIKKDAAGIHAALESLK